MRNSEVNTDLLSLLINVRLCKKSVTETVAGYADMKLLLLLLLQYEHNY
jgi:hypothetical protein